MRLRNKEIHPPDAAYGYIAYMSGWTGMLFVYIVLLCQ